MLFAHLPLLDRIDAAARAGFDGIELWSPYDIPVIKFVSRLKSVGIPLKMINTPASIMDDGGHGWAANPGRRAEFRDGLAAALEYAAATGASYVHVMSGVLPDGTDRARARDTLIENLLHASEAATGTDVMVVVEALNNTTIPGYFLNRVRLAVEVLRQVSVRNAGLLYDHFHADMIGEPVDLEPIGDLVRHVQVASVPDRAEPLHLPALLDRLHRAHYAGWISGEYKPSRRTVDGLGWMEDVRAWSPHG